MLKVESLPEHTQAELKRITSILPKDLIKEEVGFLKARREYLRPEQLGVYATILGIKKVVEPKE